jgi:hypothetical protein
MPQLVAAVAAVTADTPAASDPARRRRPKVRKVSRFQPRCGSLHFQRALRLFQGAPNERVAGTRRGPSARTCPGGDTRAPSSRPRPALAQSQGFAFEVDPAIPDSGSLHLHGQCREPEQWLEESRRMLSTAWLCFRRSSPSAGSDASLQIHSLGEAHPSGSAAGPTGAPCVLLGPHGARGCAKPMARPSAASRAMAPRWSCLTCSAKPSSILNQNKKKA